MVKEVVVDVGEVDFEIALVSLLPISELAYESLLEHVSISFLQHYTQHTFNASENHRNINLHTLSIPFLLERRYTSDRRVWSRRQSPRASGLWI
jgi:hypothetical protein